MRVCIGCFENVPGENYPPWIKNYPTSARTSQRKSYQWQQLTLAFLAIFATCAMKPVEISQRK